MRRICGVIPAAGKGSRLGLAGPKILTPVQAGSTIWSVLRDKLMPLVDHIQIVLSPAGLESFRDVLSADPSRDRISVAVQDRPVGMGDAVFRGRDRWGKFDDVLIVWGDQVNLSARTLQATLDEHRRSPSPGGTMPVTELPNPYVQYEFGPGERIIRLRQTREGDHTDLLGWSDLGVFCLSVQGLVEAWEHYLPTANLGTATQEVNFLPFLLYLCSKRSWPIRPVPIEDSSEARGVNTLGDLEFARLRLADR